MPHQRHPEHQRLLDQLFEPAIVAEARGTQAEVEEPAGLAVDQGFDPELLGEALELSRRRGAFQEVYEVSLDPSLGEEAEGFPGIGAFLDAEDLDFHGAGI
jgi:hypothetical protein